MIKRAAPGRRAVPCPTLPAAANVGAKVVQFRRTTPVAPARRPPPADRLLPHTDPFNRQITIGLGCFLETLVMAAAQDGYQVSLEYFPDGERADALDRRAVAIAHFKASDSIRPDPLFSHLAARRSTKLPYDTERTVTADALQHISASAIHGLTVGTSNSEPQLAALRRLSTAALLLEMAIPRTHLESVELFRIGKTEIEANPDGIDFGGATFELMHAAGLFNREQVLDKTSTAYREGIKAVTRNTESAMAYVWLISDGNSRSEQLAAGRDWMRINLATTALGLSAHPLSQALQEYPEMADHFRNIHETLAPEGGTIQMFARLGYAAAVAPSPRWPLESILV